MNTDTTPTPQISVGAIFCMSWGYDQTNVNFFEVTRTSPKGVFIREIAKDNSAAVNHSSMSSKVRPAPSAFLDQSQWCGRENKEKFRRLDLWKRELGFNFEGRYFAILTDPTTYHYESSYH